MNIELTDEQAKKLLVCIELCTLQGMFKKLDPHYINLVKALTPKLAEPKNFGAIVKDEHGVYWQSVNDTNLIWRWWSGSVWHHWCDIKNPTLIQPGVEE